MGAPIHTPGMRGAASCTRDGVSTNVRAWQYPRPMSLPLAGWFAFWRTPEGLQLGYDGDHPADIPRSLWREWFGPSQDLEMWKAARRELRITNHPPPGTVH